jgi:hypothetical protein
MQFGTNNTFKVDEEGMKAQAIARMDNGLRLFGVYYTSLGLTYNYRSRIRFMFVS